MSEHVPKAVEEVKAKYAEELKPLKDEFESKRIEFERLRFKIGLGHDMEGQIPADNDDLLKIRKLAKEIHKIRTRINKAEKLLSKFEEFAKKYGSK